MNRKAKWRYDLKGVRSLTQRPPVICGTNVLATFNHGQGSNFKLASDGTVLWKTQASERNTLAGIIIQDKFL